MMKKRSTTIFVGAAILCTTTSLGLFSQYKYFHAHYNGDNNKSLRTTNIIEKNQFNNNNGSNDNDNNNVNTNVNTNVPKLPILLLSGVLGGAVKQVGLKPVEYFRGIPKAMKKKGAIIFDPYTPPTSSIETRADLVSEAVEKALEDTGAKKVHLIAHSMGGLDGRYYISTLKGGSKVASLITIGTPHRGSDFADYSFEKIGEEKSKDIEEFMVDELGITIECFRQLTSKYLKQFNVDNLDDPNVKYYSYGGSKAKARDISVMYQIPYQITLRRSGPNDGIVSVESSKWGSYIRTLNADHLEQIGWETSPLSFFRWIFGDKTFHAKEFYVNELLPLLAEVEKN
mgnify:FL=1|jgi:triacylglycerol lipase